MKTFDMATGWWQFVLMAVVSYLIGCFNFAVVIAKIKKKDIRQIGSGNPGTMNMSREFGAWVGIMTFILDALKGGIPCTIAFFLYKDYVFAGSTIVVSDVARFLCGLFVIIGHIFPATMRFKGGKGVASSIGLLWTNVGLENPWFLLIGLGIVATLLVTITLVKYGALCSLVYVSGFAAWNVVLLLEKYAFATNGYLVWAFLMIFAIVLLVWVSHHKNLVKMYSGEERATSFFKKKKKVK